ncbi:hypothetical protein SAMN06265365_14242 [Tistlia consotensis]|uniref:Uncharacterized protein n=1 Tax=Tistlia consotensis USBA 355 TaxID=560819 RepID=A0A1Y6CVJ6_9PROT|nr:hypothetical protein [Tistlia consotensis]SMF82168.1 hypothetical protein SAMN05428998_14542 [Tistlia consotensis USBA 355]SNS25781.1 hypothetical protein SAMN06265365_14242 [Tistlia consotensis]
MHTESLERWTHDHTFGQDRRRPGERPTLIVALVTVLTMVVEIAAGWSFGSMALLGACPSKRLCLDARQWS